VVISVIDLSHNNIGPSVPSAPYIFDPITLGEYDGRVVPSIVYDYSFNNIRWLNETLIPPALPTTDSSQQGLLFPTPSFNFSFNPIDAASFASGVGLNSLSALALVLASPMNHRDWAHNFLSFQGCALTSFPSSLWRQVPFGVLDLSDNNLGQYSGSIGTFLSSTNSSHNTFLQTIDLRRNGLRYLPNFAFKQLVPSLRTLLLDNNPLDVLSVQSLSRLGTVAIPVSISMRYTNLVALPAALFAFSHLNVLDLSWNLLGTVDSNWLQNAFYLTSLHTLNISNNGMIYMAQGVGDSTGVTILDASYNSFSQPDSVPSFAFTSVGTASAPCMINLQYSGIRNLPELAFEGSYFSEMLLQGNPFDSVNPPALVSLSFAFIGGIDFYLPLLDMSGLGLAVLPPTTFWFSFIRQVNFSGNNFGASWVDPTDYTTWLSGVSQMAFHAFNGEVIDLSSSGITSMQWPFWNTYWTNGSPLPPMPFGLSINQVATIEGQTPASFTLLMDNNPLGTDGSMFFVFGTDVYPFTFFYSRNVTVSMTYCSLTAASGLTLDIEKPTVVRLFNVSHNNFQQSGDSSSVNLLPNSYLAEFDTIDFSHSSFTRMPMLNVLPRRVILRGNSIYLPPTVQMLDFLNQPATTTVEPMHLDLSLNGLCDVPTAFFWAYNNIIELDLSDNAFSAEACAQYGNSLDRRSPMNPAGDISVQLPLETTFRATIFIATASILLRNSSLQTLPSFWLPAGSVLNSIDLSSNNFSGPGALPSSLLSYVQVNQLLLSSSALRASSFTLGDSNSVHSLAAADIAYLHLGNSDVECATVSPHFQCNLFDPIPSGLFRAGLVPNLQTLLLGDMKDAMESIFGDWTVLTPGGVSIELHLAVGSDPADAILRALTYSVPSEFEQAPSGLRMKLRLSGQQLSSGKTQQHSYTPCLTNGCFLFPDTLFVPLDSALLQRHFFAGFASLRAGGNLAGSGNASSAVFGSSLAGPQSFTFALPSAMEPYELLTNPIQWDSALSPTSWPSDLLCDLLQTTTITIDFTIPMEAPGSPNSAPVPSVPLHHIPASVFSCLAGAEGGSLLTLDVSRSMMPAAANFLAGLSTPRFHAILDLNSLYGGDLPVPPAFYDDLDTATAIVSLPAGVTMEVSSTSCAYQQDHVCQPCPAGYWTAQTQLTSAGSSQFSYCSSCTIGHSCNFTAVYGTRPSPCAAGFYQPNLAQPNCLAVRESIHLPQ
jgi:hypothetical protein